MSNILFEDIWNKIIDNSGKSFRTIKNKEFTYKVIDNILIPIRNNKDIFKLTKNNFEKAYQQIQIEGPSKFEKDIMGSSYVWAIFNDKRIYCNL